MKEFPLEIKIRDKRLMLNEGLSTAILLTPVKSHWTILLNRKKWPIQTYNFYASWIGQSQVTALKY